MANSLKRLNKFQIIGVIIQTISFICCRFNIDVLHIGFGLVQDLT